MEQASVTLTPVPPYDFNLTALSAVHFRDQHAANRFDGAVFCRLLDVRGELCPARARSLDTLDSPQLEIVITGPSLDDATVAAAKQRLAWILDAESDLSPFYVMALQDPVLVPIVSGLRGLHLPHTASVFEALVLAILGQQISSHIAYLLRTRLTETFGAPKKIDGVTYRAFPHPEALVAAGAEGLRAIRFSARKSEYIVDISAVVASGKLEPEGLHHQPDEEVIRILTGIRGVGLWTANWLLISSLGRSNGFPSSDLALLRTLGTLVNKGKPLQPEEAVQFSGRWSPFCSYVTAYLFAAVRSGRLAELTSNQASSDSLTARKAG